MTDPARDTADDPADDAADRDATNRGVSSQEPVEGADDAPAGGVDSPGE